MTAGSPPNGAASRSVAPKSSCLTRKRSPRTCPRRQVNQRGRQDVQRSCPNHLSLPRRSTCLMTVFCSTQPHRPSRQPRSGSGDHRGVLRKFVWEDVRRRGWLLLMKAQRPGRTPGRVSGSASIAGKGAGDPCGPGSFDADGDVGEGGMIPCVGPQFHKGVR